MQIQSKLLKDFSKNVAAWINANSIVNDGWINEIIAYHGVYFKDSDLLQIRLLMTCMFIDLTLDQCADLLVPQERVTFEKAIIEHIAFTNSILMNPDEMPKRDKQRKTIENAIYHSFDFYRTKRGKQDRSIPQAYLVHLVIYGHNLPEEVWRDYINDYIKAFEEMAFRMQLHKIQE